MSRHVDAIKDMLFDEPDFDGDGDNETMSKTARRRARKKLQKHTEPEENKPSVETIVFRDPAKRRKIPKKSLLSTSTSQEQEKTDSSPIEFDLESARFDVHKFGIKGFEKSKYEDARVALAISLGAKPPKRKFINYRQLVEQSRVQKVKDKEDAENARLLGDIFRKDPSIKQKSRQQNRTKLIGQGDVGAMRFSSVGQFKSGVLKLTENDIVKVKSKGAKKGRGGGGGGSGKKRMGTKR